MPAGLGREHIGRDWLQLQTKLSSVLNGQVVQDQRSQVELSFVR